MAHDWVWAREMVAESFLKFDCSSQCNFFFFHGCHGRAMMCVRSSRLLAYGGRTLWVCARLAGPDSVWTGRATCWQCSACWDPALIGVQVSHLQMSLAAEAAFLPQSEISFGDRPDNLAAFCSLGCFSTFLDSRELHWQPCFACRSQCP